MRCSAVAAVNFTKKELIKIRLCRISACGIALQHGVFTRIIDMKVYFITGDQEHKYHPRFSLKPSAPFGSVLLFLNQHGQHLAWEVF